MHATCVQHACKGSAQNHSLHMHGDPTVVYSSPFSFGALSIEYWGVILNLMYKKASLSDVQPATV